MQKFIVTSDDRLRWGDVAMHKHLLQPGEQCIGGGVYEIDYVGSRIMLSGKSYDFGRVPWSVVPRLLVPEAWRSFDLYYEELPLSDYTEIVYE